MRRLLIQNATVITMDSQLGDQRPGDVLIEGEQIAAMAQGMGEADCAAIARISFPEAGL
jgi:hypothetical protein